MSGVRSMSVVVANHVTAHRSAGPGTPARRFNRGPAVIAARLALNHCDVVIAKDMLVPTYARVLLLLVGSLLGKKYGKADKIEKRTGMKIILGKCDIGLLSFEK